MRLFSRKEAEAAPDKMADRIAEIERSLRMLQLEWSDVLDRLHTRMRSIARERQRLQALRGEEEPSEPHVSDEEVAVEQNGMPQLDPVSERILARRNRLTNRGRQEQ